jgi:hypothetical protein
VDSSIEKIHEDNVRSVIGFIAETEVQVCLLSSEAGLPRQRNIGVDWVFNHGADGKSRIHFLDDDVTVPADYFENARRLLMQSRADMIGAWDSNLVPDSRGLVRRLIGFSPHIGSPPYSMTKAGFATAGVVPELNTNVEWVPGHSFTLTGDFLGKWTFNNEIQMIGEDVEFQLVTGAKCYMNAAHSVVHAPSPSGRLSAAEQTLANDLFRWSLCHYRPLKFSKISVSLSILFALISLCFRKPSENATEEFKGHLRFVRMGKRRKITASKLLGFSRLLD